MWNFVLEHQKGIIFLAEAVISSSHTFNCDVFKVYRQVQEAMS